MASRGRKPSRNSSNDRHPHKGVLDKAKRKSRQLRANMDKQGHQLGDDEPYYEGGPEVPQKRNSSYQNSRDPPTMVVSDLRDEFDFIERRFKDLKNHVVGSRKDVIEKMYEFHSSLSETLQSSAAGKNQSTSAWKGWLPTGEDTHKLHDEIARLREECNVANAKLATSKTQLEKLDNQLRILQSQQKVGDMESKKLKGIMLSAMGEAGEPMDNDVVKLFVNLRNLVQGILMPCNFTGFVDLQGLSHTQSLFYGGDWSTQDHRIRRLRLRAEIFRIVHDELLSKRCFGLEDSREPALAALELEFVLAEERHKIPTADWRKRTIQCIDLLPAECKGTNSRGLVVQKIFDLIAPVQPVENGEKIQKLHADITRLCESAYSFVMLVRRSKSVFAVEIPAPGRKVEGFEGDGYRIDSFEGNQPDQNHFRGSEVYYTLFGALSKVDHLYGRQVFLEPALVVCRESNVL